MIVGIGVDVVASERVAKALANGRFEERVFTAAERAACKDRADRTQALAARFAAKEACLKALGIGFGAGVALTDVEVLSGDGRRPELRLSGPAAKHARSLGVQHLHVTVSHDGDVAAAVVLLEA